MRKNTEFCLEVDLQQHIRSTQQYTKPSKMYLYGTYLFVCVGGRSVLRWWCAGAQCAAAWRAIGRQC